MMRNIFWAVLLTLLIAGSVRAADPTNQIGYNLKIEDAVSQSGTVFIGKLVSLGERDNSIDHPSLGPEYPKAKAQIWEHLKGIYDTSTHMGIYPNTTLKEETPKDGTPYIFFLRNEKEGVAPFRVIKLLPITNDNVVAVKAALRQIQNNPQAGASH